VSSTPSHSRQTYLGMKSPDFRQNKALDCNGQGFCFGLNGHEFFLA
jgi:hypothetical protein